MIWSLKDLWDSTSSSSSTSRFPVLFWLHLLPLSPSLILFQLHWLPSGSLSMSGIVSFSTFGLVSLHGHSHFRQLQGSLPDSFSSSVQCHFVTQVFDTIQQYTSYPHCLHSPDIFCHIILLYFPLKYWSMIDILYLYLVIVWIAPSECKLNEGRDFIHSIPYCITSFWNSLLHVVGAQEIVVKWLTAWLGEWMNRNRPCIRHWAQHSGLTANKKNMAPAFMTHALYWLLAFSFSLKHCSNFFYG